MSLEIRPVDRWRDLRAFVNVPFRLYGVDGTWVPPLKLERYQYLTPKLNAFFKHGEAQLFLALRDGRAVGRISAHIDRAYNAYHDARWGWFGREDGELQHPEGVAVDSDGSIYVADRGNARIQKFDRNGAYVLQWRGPEESPDASADRFSPHDIALGPHGNVYVLAHTKVFRFDRAGTPLGSWRSDSLTSRLSFGATDM